MDENGSDFLQPLNVTSFLIAWNTLKSCAQTGALTRYHKLDFFAKLIEAAVTFFIIFFHLNTI